MRIGEVAKRAGVSVDAVRLYERKGLLKPAPRTSSGYRVFGSDAITRIAVIKQAQSVGASLEAAGLLLRAIDAGHVDQLAVANYLQDRISELDARLEELKATRERVAEMKKAFASGECAELIATIEDLRRTDAGSQTHLE